MEEESSGGGSDDDSSGGRGGAGGSQEDQFKFVFGSLVDLYKWNMSLMRDVIVFSLLVVGWLVTSKYSRQYIKDNEQVLHITLGVIGVLYGLFLFESIKSRRESNRKMRQLAAIGFADEAYYDNYQISVGMIILGAAMVGMVFGLLITILLTL